MPRGKYQVALKGREGSAPFLPALVDSYHYKNRKKHPAEITSPPSIYSYMTELKNMKQ